MALSSPTELLPVCSSLAARATSGAREINGVLTDHSDQSEALEFQKLQLLSTKLQKLAVDAQAFGDKVRSAQVVSLDLQTTLSAHLPELDTSSATLTKQVMRVGRDTPREAINVAVLLQYEVFLDVSASFLTLMIHLLSRYDDRIAEQISNFTASSPNLFIRCRSSKADQDRSLSHEDTKLLLIRTASACHDIARSNDILRVDQPAHALQDASGSMPPAYEELPPPFDNSPAYVESSPSAAPPEAAHGFRDSDSPTPNVDKGKAKESSSGGFLSAFKAVTSVLRAKPEPLVVPLCQASANGNVPQVKALLNQGANINGRNEEGQTPLICTIQSGQLDVLRFLLSAGADHGIRDSGRKGKTPLLHAIEAQNRDAAELLLTHGVDPNQADEWGQPYFASLVRGDTAPSWIELLLSFGADPNGKDVHGRPLVILAAQKRAKQPDCEEVVNLLLRHGAKPGSKSPEGTPLIHIALQQKRERLVYRLLEIGANPNAKDLSGISLLAVALKKNDHALAKALLERGADPNAADIYGSYPIINVLCEKRLAPADRDALARILLEHGARGDRKDLWGVTAVEHTVVPILESVAPPPSNSQNIGIVELILRNGGDANQTLSKVPGEPTLLTHALDRSGWDIAAVALRYGANPNLRDTEGRTPLLLSVRKGSAEAVGLLIQHGAMVNYPRQSLPLDVALSQGDTEIVSLLRSQGAVSAARLPDSAVH